MCVYFCASVYYNLNIENVPMFSFNSFFHLCVYMTQNIGVARKESCVSSTQVNSPSTALSAVQFPTHLFIYLSTHSSIHTFPYLSTCISNRLYIHSFSYHPSLPLCISPFTYASTNQFIRPYLPYYFFSYATTHPSSLLTLIFSPSHSKSMV